MGAMKPLLLLTCAVLLFACAKTDSDPADAGSGTGGSAGSGNAAGTGSAAGVGGMSSGGMSSTATGGAGGVSGAGNAGSAGSAGSAGTSATGGSAGNAGSSGIGGDSGAGGAGQGGTTGCGEGAPGCGEEGAPCCDPAPCDGPNFCHDALQCCGDGCASDCGMTGGGRCTIPCSGLAPDPQVQMDCFSFTTQEQCTAYESTEFPFACAWEVGPVEPCLAP